MYRAPSQKNLEKSFPSVAPENLAQIRTLLQEGKRLGDIDALLGTYGVEYVRDHEGAVIASYCNSGDTYAPTLLRVYPSRNVRLTTLGDFVETYERSHAALP